jgi:hypothetical protein
MLNVIKLNVVMLSVVMLSVVVLNVVAPKLQQNNFIKSSQMSQFFAIILCGTSSGG